MADRPHPADRLPHEATLDEARAKAARCRACDLWRRATCWAGRLRWLDIAGARLVADLRQAAARAR